MMTEKLQKVLARTGLGSRRAIEQWISDGRVKVDGKVAKLGDRVTLDAKITVDNRLIRLESPETFTRRVLLYNKPEGQVCSRKDPEDRPTVFENFPSIRSGRWLTVGRLDIGTSGLLLVTNDGELANQLMHPASEIEREYAVRVLGRVDAAMLERLHAGVELDDGKAAFDEIIDVGGEGANHWYHVILREGRNREVRRLWESQGVKVSRLIRVRYAYFTLERSLRPGKTLELTPFEIAELSKFIDEGK